jgi:hypothetical protein
VAVGPNISVTPTDVKMSSVTVIKYLEVTSNTDVSMAYAYTPILVVKNTSASSVTITTSAMSSFTLFPGAITTLLETSSFNFTRLQ